MGLSSSIKKKLFWKRSSSAASTVPAAHTQTPHQIRESLVAHESQVHLHPSELLIPESSVSEALNSGHQPDKQELSTTDYLLNAFPIIKDLFERYEEHSNEQNVGNEKSYRRSARFKHLGYVSSALISLEEHLSRMDDSGEFDNTITQLAKCLESMMVREYAPVSNYPQSCGQSV